MGREKHRLVETVGDDNQPRDDGRPMIKLHSIIDRARRRPVLGLLVLVLLVALLALVALHPAIDALELAASCLTILAIAISIAIIRRPVEQIVSAAPLAPAHARPPTARPFARVPQLLVPLRL